MRRLLRGVLAVSRTGHRTHGTGPAATVAITSPLTAANWPQTAPRRDRSRPPPGRAVTANGIEIGTPMPPEPGRWPSRTRSRGHLDSLGL